VQPTIVSQGHDHGSAVLEIGDGRSDLDMAPHHDPADRRTDDRLFHVSPHSTEGILCFAHRGTSGCLFSVGIPEADLGKRRAVLLELERLAGGDALSMKPLHPLEITPGLAKLELGSTDQIHPSPGAAFREGRCQLGHPIFETLAIELDEGLARFDPIAVVDVHVGHDARDLGLHHHPRTGLEAAVGDDQLTEDPPLDGHRIQVRGQVPILWPEVRGQAHIGQRQEKRRDSDAEECISQATGPAKTACTFARHDLPREQVPSQSET